MVTKGTMLGRRKGDADGVQMGESGGTGAFWPLYAIPSLLALGLDLICSKELWRPAIREHGLECSTCSILRHASCFSWMQAFRLSRHFYRELKRRRFLDCGVWLQI